MEYINKNLVFEIVKGVLNLLIEEDKVKSLLPKISNDAPKIYEGFMSNLSDLYKFANNEYKDKIVNVVLDNIALDNLIEVKEVDLQEEPKADWLQELQDKIDSLSKEDFEKVMAKYSRYGEEGSVNYDKLNTMLDESLSKETKESWNKRLGEEPVSELLNTESMIESYKRRLISQTNGVKNSPLIDMCLASYKYGINETLDTLNLSNVQRNGKGWKEEPVSEELEDAAEDYCKSTLIGSHYIKKNAFKAGAKWQKENLWKSADGDDLPEIDREVIALLDNGNVVFAHRPPEYWDGKDIVTGKVTRHYPMIYEGGWNIPYVKYWLDCLMPKEIEL